MKCTVGELKQVIREAYQTKQAAKTKTLIEGILSEKGLLDRIGGALGRVNPSLDVDDPKKAKSAISKAVGAASKKGDAFKKDALADTKRVNDYHDAVKDVIDKVTALGDSLPKDEGVAAEKDMITAIRGFYDNLRNAADRLDSFIKTMNSDVDEKVPTPSLPKPVSVDKGKPGAGAKRIPSLKPANDEELPRARRAG